MDASNCLDNLIQSEGSNPDDWETIVDALRRDKQE